MRKNLGKIVDEDELRSIDLVQTKISCARQALGIVPEGTQEQMGFYVQSCIDSLGNYTWLQKDWWSNIIKKYELGTDNVYIDFNTGELYLNE